MILLIITRKMEYRRIGLYGISSTGKTTVAKLIEQIHPQYKFIDGSDVFNKVCPGGLSAFKELSFDDKNKYRHLAIDYLTELQKTIKQHFIIAGHYSFITKNNNFEIAWTKADEEFYTDIFVFEDIPTKIYQRNIQRGLNYSIEQIKKWQEFEVSQIAKLHNQKIFLKKEVTIKKSALFILKEINKTLILNNLSTESTGTILPRKLITPKTRSSLSGIFTIVALVSTSVTSCEAMA